MNKGTAIVGFLICFIAGGGLMWSIDRSSGAHGVANISAEAGGDAAGAWSDAAAAVPVTSQDPMWGSRNAPVTLVLFSDYQCPFCTRVETTMDQLKTKYGKDKIRIVWKNNPLSFHANARPAAIAAETVFRLGGNDAFWKFHKLAFDNQKDLNDANYEAWAAQAGVDKAKFKAAYAKQEAAAAKVDADLALGKSSGVSGTPATFINGVFLSGAQPIDKFTAVIDEQLKAAQQAIASGTKADKVYVKLSGENKAKAPAAEAKREEPAEDKSVWKVPAGNSPARGPATALVTIIEFSDFQCPFCSKVEPTLNEVVKTYGDKVRVVWKNNPLPFHPHAEPAAELAMEAFKQKGADGFWAAHEKLFANQKALEEADLLGYAKDLGLNVDAVKTAISTKKYGDLITADQDLGDSVQASGTPHFFINGRRLVGAQPFEKFKSVIDEEITKANAMLAKGVAAKDLYEEIIKDGKTPPPPEQKTVAAPDVNSPWKGNPNAKVIMEIFSDFECPFCARVEPTLAQVEKDYGTKLKFVWRHKPLAMHQKAPLASEAAQEAFKQQSNAGFWKFHEKLFAGQRDPGLDRPALEGYAKDLGLNMDAFGKALDARTHKAFVDSESAVADKAGISGTPAFVVGTVQGQELKGYFISGAQPYAKFKKVIDLALKEAK